MQRHAPEPTLEHGGRSDRDRFYFAGMAIVAAAIVFFGFARSYYLKGLFERPPLAPLLHLHGFLFTSWLVLLLSQVALVAAKRTDFHRRLGIVGGLLAIPGQPGAARALRDSRANAVERAAHVASHRGWARHLRPCAAAVASTEPGAGDQDSALTHRQHSVAGSQHSA